MDKPVDNSPEMWNRLSSLTCLFPVDKYDLLTSLLTISVDKSPPTWGLISTNIWLSTRMHRFDNSVHTLNSPQHAPFKHVMGLFHSFHRTYDYYYFY